MKLYLWRAVFADWTSGMAMAIAEDKKQAVELALKGHEYYATMRNATWEGAGRILEEKRKELRDSVCEEHELTEPFGFAVSGGG